jgi:hypothetical protein
MIKDGREAGRLAERGDWRGEAGRRGPGRRGVAIVMSVRR